MKNRVTLKDIADQTGYSMNTVSKALNHKGGLSSKTLQTIQECAYRCGYSPNMMARSMRGLDNNLIGVLISDLSDEFFVSLLAGIEEEAALRGMTVLVQNASEDPEKQIEGLNKLLSYGCQWIIVTPVQNYGSILPHLRSENARIVVADRVGPGMEALDRVSINNRGDVKRAVGRLLAQGHRRIAFINRDSGVETEIERTRGYREALAAAGIQADPDLLLLCWDEETARKRVLELMCGEERPTAMFLGMDKFACGVLLALKEARVRVPEDLTLCIYGSMEWTRLYSPSIQMVRRDIRQLGRSSVCVLMDQRGARDGEPINLVLDSQLP